MCAHRITIKFWDEGTRSTEPVVEVERVVSENVRKFGNLQTALEEDPMTGLFLNVFH